MITKPIVLIPTCLQPDSLNRLNFRTPTNLPNIKIPNINLPNINHSLKYLRSTTSSYLMV